MGHFRHHKDNGGDTPAAPATVRAGCTVRMRLSVSDGGVALDWNDPLLSVGDVAVWSEPRQGVVGRPVFSVDADDPRLLVVEHTTGALDVPGLHRLLVTVRYGGWTAVHSAPAYILTGGVFGHGTSVTADGSCPSDAETDIAITLHDADTTYIQSLLDAAAALTVGESARLTALEIVSEALRRDTDGNRREISRLLRLTGLQKDIDVSLLDRIEELEERVRRLEEGGTSDPEPEPEPEPDPDPDPDPETEYATLTIVPTPSDAVVYIDGEERSEITVEAGTAVRWAVGAVGYETQTGTLTLDRDTVREVVLERTMCEITFRVTPADAEVTVNGTEIETDGNGEAAVTAAYGDVLEWSVSHLGHVTRSGSETVTGDRTIEVELDVLRLTLTIVPTPDDAKVTMNGIATASSEFDYGTVVEWTVSRDGYVTRSGSETVTEDRTIEVVLEEGEPEYATFTITPVPIDATVVIDGEERGWITVAVGTAVEWSVSKEGYVTQSGTHTVTGDYALTVTLSVEPYLTVEPSSLLFNAAASAGFLDIDSSSAWSVETPALLGWLALSATGGEAGATRITVSASENLLTNSRSVTLTFTNDDGLTAEFTATQAAASGGDTGGDDPDPDPEEDSITLSSSYVSSGEWFTLDVGGSASSLTAALYNEAAIGTNEIVLRFGGNDGTDYVLTDEGCEIPVVSGGSYLCRVNNEHTQEADVQFTYGGASALLRVAAGGTLPTAGGESETNKEE